MINKNFLLYIIFLNLLIVPLILLLSFNKFPNHEFLLFVIIFTLMIILVVLVFMMVYQEISNHVKEPIVDLIPLYNIQQSKYSTWQFFTSQFPSFVFYFVNATSILLIFNLHLAAQHSSFLGFISRVIVKDPFLVFVLIDLIGFTTLYLPFVVTQRLRVNLLLATSSIKLPRKQIKHEMELVNANFLKRYPMFFILYSFFSGIIAFAIYFLKNLITRELTFDDVFVVVINTFITLYGSIFIMIVWIRLLFIHAIRPKGISYIQEVEIHIKENIIFDLLSSIVIAIFVLVLNIVVFYFFPQYYFDSIILSIGIIIPISSHYFVWFYSKFRKSQIVQNTESRSI